MDKNWVLKIATGIRVCFKKLCSLAWGGGKGDGL